MNGLCVQCYDGKGLPSRGDSLHPEPSRTGLPDAFGSYRVLHQIGAGALGPVFRAYDPECDRLAAVKLFRLDLPPERCHKFVAELEKLIDLHLTHSGIALPLATGIVGASAYLAMDYVPADALDTVIRQRGPASPADAVRFAARLARALDSAAAVGVLHGALHPRDVLVSLDDTRLTGLGIVGALQHAAVDGPIRRPYGAPERAAGQSWDRRADIFSLAVITHQMLWGRRLSASGKQLFGPLAGINGINHEALRDVFERALAERPDDRFGTALAFATALKDAMLSAATLEEPPYHEQHEPASSPGGSRARDEDGLLLALDEPAPQPRSSSVAAGEPARAASLGVDEPIRDLDLRVEKPRYENIEIAPGVAPGKIEPVPLMSFPTESAEAGGLRLDPSISGEPSEAVADLPTAAAAFEMAPDKSPIRQAVEAEGAIISGDRSQMTPAFPGPAAGSLGLGSFAPVPGALERTRSAVWPLVLALLVGLALGFSGGYGVGSRDRQTSQAIQAPPQPPRAATAAPSPDAAMSGSAAKSTSAATSPPGSPREFTETAVQQPANPSSRPSSSGTPPQAARRQQESSRQSDRSTAETGSLGRLLVRSTPAGARVRLDGRDVGATPVTLRDLASGAHQIRVALDGYVPTDRRITITSSTPAQSVTVELARVRAAVPEPPTPATLGRSSGALRFESRPAGATVYVDGRVAGTTPASLDDVRPGEHAVRFERDGYRPWAASVHVAAGEVNRVTASLER